MYKQTAITIKGKPEAQQRPRFSRKLGRAYDCQKEIKDSMTYQAAMQWGDEKPIETGCIMTIAFYMPLPKATSKKKLAAIVGEPAVSCNKDIDNLCKIAIDCLLGPVLFDDHLIWELNATKKWAAPGNGRTEILLSWDDEWV